MLLTFPTKESMLRKLRESDSSDVYLIISNFKSLAGWNLIPLRPLSILLGPNSAGKSTVYDALRILRRLGANDIKINEEKSLVFELCARNKNTGPVVGFSCPYDFPQSTTHGRSVLSDMIEPAMFFLPEDINEKIYSGDFPFLSTLIRDERLRNHLQSIRYTLLVNELEREDGRLEMTSLVDSIELASWVSDASNQTVTTNVDAIRLLLRGFVSSKLVEESCVINFNSGDFSATEELVPIFDTFPAYVYGSYVDTSHRNSDESIDFEDKQQQDDHVSGLLMTLFNFPIATFLSWVNGPATEDVRILTSDWQFITPGGNSYLEFQPELGAKNSFISRRPESRSGRVLLTHEISCSVGKINDGKCNDRLFIEQSWYLKKINMWLSSAAFLGSAYNLRLQVKECSPIGVIETGNDYLGSGVEYLARLYLVDDVGRSLTFSNVGTGFSQVIPVLIDLAFDDSLLYKQPEVHLHPKLQSKIADCFVERVNTLRKGATRRVRLIETHSEHFVLRILRRLKESFRDELLHSSLTTYPSDFSLVYFKPVGDASEIHEIRVSDDGKFIDRWPDGFFDERDEDIWVSIS